MSSARVHRAAAGGFGSAAAVYERVRPDYPREAVDRLVQELEVTRLSRILDLGAGTGKLSRMMAPTGARIVALDPVEPMLRELVEAVPGVPAVRAVAEALPVGDGTFTGVVCAQAFHWFDGPAALAEIHRALAPRGRLGLLWNLRDGSVDWVRQLEGIIAPFQARVPHEQTEKWREAFSATDLFGTLHRLRFTHGQTLDRDGLVARIASASFIAVLPPEKRAEVLDRVRDLAGSHPDLAGEQRFRLPYVTELYWCARI